MPLEVGHAALECGQILLAQRVLGDAAVHLERAHGGDDHRRVGLEAGLAALDVEELLRPQVGAEAGLGDHVVAELERGAGRHRRVAAMGDVGERAAMDEGGIALQGLHEIGRERVLEQHGHGAGGLEVGGEHRLAVAVVARDHLAQALLEVLEAGGEAEHGHHLGGHGDVEAVLAREAVGDAAERGDDLAQRAVVHVDRAAPGDPALVDAQRVAPVDVVVEHRRQQVVGAADGVEVAGEVQVDLLHRHDLGIAAAGGPALHAEAGAERRLAQGDHRLLADPVQPVAQAHRGRGLALAGRGRVDRGHQHQPAVGAVGLLGDPAQVELGDVAAVVEQRRVGDPHPLGHGLDRLQLGRARDLDVRRHAHP